LTVRDPGHTLIFTIQYLDSAEWNNRNDGDQQD
jgi:hypothetical protein